MKTRPFVLVALLVFVLLGSRGHGEINDLMELPAPAAKSRIDIDGRGFVIDGRRTFVASGSIHYPRVPHELWRDRLLRIQRASFNCVQTYAFWNFHEPRENEFDFTGDRDIGGFLDTAQQLGLYATVRPGPYVCAEWDSGGFPIWLKFKPPMHMRTDDPQFLALNDHWYDKILPIITSHPDSSQRGQRDHGAIGERTSQGLGRWSRALAYFDHLESKAKGIGKSKCRTS